MHSDTHISQRSAGSRIAVSLHHDLTINAWRQISSHGNPFKGHTPLWLVPGLNLCQSVRPVYANVVVLFEPVRAEWYEGLNQAHSVCAILLCLCVSPHSVSWFSVKRYFFLKSLLYFVQCNPYTRLWVISTVFCFCICLTCPEGGSS